VSEHRDLLIDAVERMLSERCTPEVVAAAEHEWPAELWDVLEQAGLPLAPVGEDAGGGGATVGDALAVAGRAARHAAPVPHAETGLIAGRLLEEVGLEVPSGPLAAYWGPDVAFDGSRLSGVASGVPWARVATRLVVVAGGQVCAVDPASASITEVSNIAGDARDDVRLDAVAPIGSAPSIVGPQQLDAFGALVRATQIAGALTTILELSVRYAGEREQFGRPIGRFQAVQMMLAELAGEAAAANAAVGLATGAYEQDPAGARAPIAVAKVRCGQAAGLGAELAHQVHGAIGYTDEHQLHLFTRRALAWRDEHGSEAVWAGELGRAALQAGPWPLVTSAP
jgi:acyl-CoA dehydrogenase